METFADYKKLNEARDELKKAFKKNAALRATKKELEKKVKKIESLMMENEEVNQILAKAKYKSLAILNDRKFLSEIEEDVAKEYRAAKRRSKARVKKGTVQKRNNQTLSQREAFITGLVKRLKKPVFPVKEIEKALRDIGIKTNPVTYLKQLKLPEGCIKRVSKSPKDGSNFHVKASKELAKHL